MPKIAIFTPPNASEDVITIANEIAIALAKLIQTQGKGIQVVFAYNKEEDEANLSRLSGLNNLAIKLREAWWEMITGKKLAQFSVPFIARQLVEPLQHQAYCYARDGANDFCDCDLWVMIGEPFPAPIFPIRKTIHVSPKDANAKAEIDRISQFIFEASFKDDTNHA